MKLDEVRYVMNRLMGPTGTLNEDERNQFLNAGTLAEHDALLGQGAQI